MIKLWAGCHPVGAAALPEMSSCPLQWQVFCCCMLFVNMYICTYNVMHICIFIYVYINKVHTYVGWNHFSIYSWNCLQKSIHSSHIYPNHCPLCNPHRILPMFFFLFIFNFFVLYIHTFFTLPSFSSFLAFNAFDHLIPQFFFLLNFGCMLRYHGKLTIKGTNERYKTIRFDHHFFLVCTLFLSRFLIIFHLFVL